jgi:hypothetical protein
MLYISFFLKKIAVLSRLSSICKSNKFTNNLSSLTLSISLGSIDVTEFSRALNGIGWIRAWCWWLMRAVSPITTVWKNAWYI